ncbi:hypothetical protein [Streptomyces sp. NPDC085540]|uniref:hypothetical protein n=1 Tax=Streptomyces sp. NPDC085540 TaxID=3365730 RepID=UPI0037D95830
MAYELLGSAGDAEDVLQETWLRRVEVDGEQVRGAPAWSPTERAVLALREVFDVDCAEIGATVDRSPAAVRQIAHRAHRHVDARRPPSSVRARWSPSHTRTTLESFRHAFESGDLQVLLAVLTPEAAFAGDGGGEQASTRPAVGADEVARFIIGGTAENGAAPLQRPHRGHRHPLCPQPADADPRRRGDPAVPAAHQGPGAGGGRRDVGFCGLSGRTPAPRASFGGPPGRIPPIAPHGS